ARRAEVIVHELLHLKVPNHGRLFRALLKSYLSKKW
ncbi:YgjP-like metallopeptidase domain-containing protein, partial [Roseiflexus sp.]